MVKTANDTCASNTNKKTALLYGSQYKVIPDAELLIIIIMDIFPGVYLICNTHTHSRENLNISFNFDSQATPLKYY